MSLGDWGIALRITIVDTEPDGERCDGCGGVVYLKAKHLCVGAAIDGGMKKYEPKPVAYFCESCAEIIAEEMPEIQR